MNSPISVCSKNHFVSFILLFFSLSLFAQSAINSFAPVSGTVGTTVIISGTNFNANAANNIVFFGAVKANVTAATTTSLTVIVPTGATYQPITVTVNNLTAYSSKPFIVTFAGGGIITSNSFGDAITVDDVPNSASRDQAAGDIDGDSKNDIAVVDLDLNTVSIYKNTSTGGVVSFASKIDYPTGNWPIAIAMEDLNGDGKKDLVVANLKDSSVSVYKNTSTVGSISFAAGLIFNTGINPSDISINDLDGDGKPDLAIVNATVFSPPISILRNTSVGGTISFATKKDIDIVRSPFKISVGDLDGDGKPDLAITDYVFNVISVFRNTSVTGNISFSYPVDFVANSQPKGIAMGDMDNDGRTDLVVANFDSDRISIFKNTCTPGNISFSAKTDYNAGSWTNYVAINDLDGDGKLEIAITGHDPVGNASLIHVYKNTSTPGAISFTEKIDYPVLGSDKITIADFNGDSRPEMAVAGSSLRSVVYKNKVGEPDISSFAPASASSGTTVTITGYNFTGVTGVNFGAVAATSFTVVNGTTITAVVGNGASGDIVVTAPHGTGRKDGFTFFAQPTITSFTPASGGNGTTVEIAGTNFSGATSVSFGSMATTFTVNSQTSITAIVSNGSSGSVTVTTPGGSAALAGFNYSGPTVSSFTPTVGGIGTIVTIKGYNFTGTNLVSFGGTAAESYIVTGDTTITAKVATGSTGNLLVNTTSGTAIAPGFVYMGPAISSFTPTSGKAATVVTITGTNFTGATAVNFGNTPATSFTVVNATTIKAEVATGSSGSVSITTAYGTVELPGFIYTGPPVITSFTPTTAGPGSIIIITGSHFSGTTSVSFGAKAADSFSVVSYNTIHAVVGLAGASGNVSVKTNFGTTSLPGFIFTPIPKINSFTPVLGPVGTTVTITGEKFSAIPANNIVYFGAVRATVTAATTTSLKVIVPIGATHEPISVLVNGLTAYSSKPFTVTFQNNGYISFDTGSFRRTDIPVIGDFGFVGVSDLNADNKPDIVLANRAGNVGVSVLKNASSVDSLSFGDPLDFHTDLLSEGIFIKDLDGDAKPDLLVGSSASELSLFRNTSSGSAISFAPIMNIIAGNYPIYCFVEDLDGDGKPDVVTANYYGESLGILRNTSTIGNLSFSPLIDYVISGRPISIFIRDMDGDKKPDIILATSNPDVVVVLRNTSSIGKISFEASDNFPGCNALSVGDLDGDGKPDIVASLRGSANFYRNTSLAGSISFDVTSFESNVEESLISLDDINGDGKLDMVFDDKTFMFLFRNTSTIGNILFDPKIRFLFGYQSSNAVIGDMDGNGKPDIIGQSTIFRNMIGKFRITSFSPRDAGTGTAVTISGVDLSKVSSVSFGGIPASSFTIDSPNSIAAIVGNGASGSVRLTTSTDIDSLEGFKFWLAPSFTSFTPSMGNPGTVITIHGANLTGTTAISFGGVPAESFTINSSTSITAVVGTGASGNISVTTPGGTATLAGFTFIPMPNITSFTPTSGGTGASVTITGTNFAGATAVSFGGIDATSFTVNSSTSITAVVGTGASGNISVTTSGGKATLAGFTFIPMPTIISFTPSSGGTGASITITGTNFTGTTAVSFGGIAATSFTVNSSTSITAVVGTGASGDVTITTPGGTATLAGFTFKAPPTIISFTPAKGKSGVAVTITGTNFDETSAVSFGGVAAASFTVNSSTSISAIIGTGASGDLSVTTPYGTATIAGFAFEAGRGVNELVAYPNPADGFVLIKHPSTDNTAQLKLIDMTGKVVKVIVVERNVSETRIEISDLKPGIYEVVWNDGRNSLIQKMVKR